MTASLPYHRTQTDYMSNTQEAGFVNKIYDGVYHSGQDDPAKAAFGRYEAPVSKKKKVTGKKKAKSPSPGLRKKRA